MEHLSELIEIRVGIPSQGVHRGGTELNFEREPERLLHGRPLQPEPRDGSHPGEGRTLGG